jgi:hypothetical protein
LAIHSLLPHRLLGWRMVLLLHLTKFFKLGSECRQLNSHIGCHILSVEIFRFCHINWECSFIQMRRGKQKKSERCTFRHLRIILKKIAKEFNHRKLTEFLFEARIRCKIRQTLVILHRHAIRLLWKTLWIADPTNVDRWKMGSVSEMPIGKHWNVERCYHK